MLFVSSEGVYLYLYNVTNDVPSFADYYFDAIDEAEEICFKDYNIKRSDWININEPEAYCQHDIISPVRIKGRELGKPQWGKFEKLVNGKWVDYEF